MSLDAVPVNRARAALLVIAIGCTVGGMLVGGRLHATSLDAMRASCARAGGVFEAQAIGVFGNVRGQCHINGVGAPR